MVEGFLVNVHMELIPVAVTVPWYMSMAPVLALPLFSSIADRAIQSVNPLI
jgi:hypothetical protein